MASDAPPGHFQQPQGFSVSLQVEDPAEAERRFKALAEGGSVRHAVRQDVLLQGFWHVHRQVRHSLDGELPEGDSDACCSGSRSVAKRSVPTMLLQDGGHGARAPLPTLRVLRSLPAPRIDRREFAPAQQQQPRRQSAAAADPVSHRRGIGVLHLASRLPARHTSARGGRSSARREIRAPRAASRRCARSAPSSAPACRPTGTARRSPRVRRIARTRSNSSRNGPTWPPGLARMRISARAGGSARCAEQRYEHR